MHGQVGPPRFAGSGAASQRPGRRCTVRRRDRSARQSVSTAAAPLEAQALAAITRVTLAAVADGRVVPRAMDHDRGDTRHHWAVGPWSVTESSDLRRIADHLPPALRAEPVGEKPLGVLDSFTVVTRFADAVADALVSTPAAACRKLTLDPVEIGDIEAQLVGSGPVLVARLELTETGALLRFEARNRTDQLSAAAHRRSGPTLRTRR